MAEIKTTLTAQTTELTKEMINDLHKDLKPIILGLGIILCIGFSTLGSSLAITQYATGIAQIMHQPAARIWVYILGAFSISPFLMSLIIVLMKNNIYNYEIKLSKAMNEACKLMGFGVANAIAGHAMGKISTVSVNMIVKDKSSTFKVYMIYCLLELIVIFGFLILFLQGSDKKQ